eukprot:GFUD01031312.1.p1 GENE.GFUD01031312.1~~GFUD01031312.1.p1  ORF type:complete len:171 (-),score=37.64 GFUD01031312.1:28-540(-)
METLRKKSMMAVIKLGIPKSELPETVKKEVKTLEERIKSDWTGVFRSWYLWRNQSNYVKIDWSGGVWWFQFYKDGPTFTIPVAQMPAIKIKAGSSYDLGYQGGIMFLLNGKKIWIDDYRVVEDREVIFYGSYSSKIATRRQFKATMSVGDQNRLRMEVVQAGMGVEDNEV